MDTAQKIDTYIASLPEWQGANLRDFRALVHDAAPAITEDWKWAVPVFIYGGKIMFAMSAFKDHTKFNFLNGADLPEQGLFNSGLDSKRHRSLNSAEDDPIDWAALRRAISDSIKFIV